MIRRLIRYDKGGVCDCCTGFEPFYDMWEDGVLVSENNWCDLCSDEDELKEHLKHLEPFDVELSSEWF